MKRLFIVSILPFSLFLFSNQSWSFFSENTSPPITSNSDKKQMSHNEWLKARFGKQHQALIPVVAVADMFFMCNQARKTDNTSYQLSFLINQMDKNTLAEKLDHCLGEDNVKSDVALNFGLEACFQEQVSHLPEVEREQKMMLVKKAIASLSLTERERSFTQCVTEQSIHYLK